MLQAIRVNRHCTLESDRCIVKRNQNLWPLQHRVHKAVQHGAYFEVLLPPSSVPNVDTFAALRLRQAGVHDSDAIPFLERHGLPPSRSSHGSDPDTEHSDDHDQVHLMQRLTERHLTFHDDQIDAQPFWIQMLAVQWRRLALEPDGVECPSAQVITWFLHGRTHRRCEHERTIRLYEDPNAWEEAIMRTWADVIDPHAEIVYWTVHPEVPDMQPPNCAHLLVVQDPPDTMIAALFSAYDGIGAPEMPSRVAQFTDRQVTCEAILSATSFLGECVAGPLRDLCTCWTRHDQLVLDGQSHPGHNGQRFFVLIAETFQPISARQQSPDPHDPGDNFAQVPDESASFLQLHHVTLLDSSDQAIDPKVELRLADHIDQKQEICVDFASIFALHDILCQTALPIDQAWPDMPRKDDVIQPAWNYRMWRDAPFQKIAFYTDGSYSRDLGASAAIVGLVETCDGWQVLGHMKYKCHGEYAYQGEYSAMACALLWASQISERTLLANPMGVLTFEFHFDCVAAGYIAAGHWQSVHAEWSIVLRSLCQILQTNHGLYSLSWFHVPAHAGNLWNEMCDSLAKWIAKQDVLTWVEPWRDWLSTPITETALQWLWSLRPFSMNHPALPRLTGMMLKHAHDPQPLPSVHQQSTTGFTHRGKTVDCCICLATCNVLTLEDRQLPTIGARQLSLMQQFSEAGAHVVCLQETRHKRVSQNNPQYHVYGCAATDKGQEGVQIWVRRKWQQPTCTLEVPYKATRVVAMESNFMIVKLQVGAWKGAIVNVHAPHADHGEQSIQKFWSNIRNIICERCRGWQLYLAGDMNAHVGSQISDAIGGHHPAAENVPGHVFHDWLLEQRLWAPSAFSHTQVGSSDTYVSVRAETLHRLDYVCLSNDIDASRVRTWVDDSIEVATQKTDHYPVFCSWHQQLQISKRWRQSSHQGPLTGREVAAHIQQVPAQVDLSQKLILPPWNMTVHQQADEMAEQVRAALSNSGEPQLRPLRKRRLSIATQTLVRTKQQTYKAHKSSLANGRCFFLRVVFQAWKGGARPSYPVLDIQACDDWLRDHDKLSAMQTLHLSNLALAVRQAVRAEDAQFFMTIADNAAKAFSQEGLHALWKQIKNAIPKHRSKRLAPPMDLGADLQSHFEQLEAGQTTTWDTHLSQCHARQQALAHNSMHGCVVLSELPTLVEIENLSRKQQSHKAPGPDGIPCAPFLKVKGPFKMQLAIVESC